MNNRGLESVRRYAAPGANQSKVAEMERLYDQVAVYLNPCATERLHELLAEVFDQGRQAGLAMPRKPSAGRL